MKDSKLNNIKLIVCDLDGTLLDDEKNLDANIVSVLKDINIPFTFASGRNVQIVQRYLKELDIKLPYICNNGANIFDKDECVLETPIVASELNGALRLLNKHYIPFLAYTRGTIYQFGNNATLDWFVQRLIGTTIIKHDVYPEGDVFKVVITPGDDKEMMEVAEEIRKLYPNTECARSEGPNYCLTNKHSNKGFGLEWLMKHLGLNKDEVLVFGDNYNDIPMFEVVSNSVAMSEASQEVKDHATYVCGSNNECGVSNFLKDHFG